MNAFIKEFNQLNKVPALVVIGCSAGGLEVLKVLLSDLPKKFQPALVIVQHISVDAPQPLAEFFQPISSIQVKEAEDKETIRSGIAYFAPAGYHLMISDRNTFQLSVEEPVNYSRPSIDVLFETAADAYGEKLLGIVLTGANEDGAKGLARIHSRGGSIVIQDPAAAEFSNMPMAALKAVPGPDRLFSLKEIQSLLVGFS